MTLQVLKLFCLTHLLETHSVVKEMNWTLGMALLNLVGLVGLIGQ